MKTSMDVVLFIEMNGGLNYVKDIDASICKRKYRGS